MQTWRGCVETVSLSAVSSLVLDPPLPVLSVEPPARLSLPEAKVSLPRPAVAEEMPVARTQQLISPASEGDIQVLDHLPANSASIPDAEASLQLKDESSKSLWTRADIPLELEPASLRVLPNEPSEIRYRIWLDAIPDTPDRILPRAMLAPCPPSSQPGLEAVVFAIERVAGFTLPGYPPMNSFSARGLTASAGALLQSAIAQTATHQEPMLYPGSRRLPTALADPHA